MGEASIYMWLMTCQPDGDYIALARVCIPEVSHQTAQRQEENPVWSSHWNAALCLMLWWNGRAKWPNPAFAFDLVSAKPDVFITFFFFNLRQNCVWGNVFPEKPREGPTCISSLCWGGWWGFKVLLGEILLTGRLGHWESPWLHVFLLLCEEGSAQQDQCKQIPMGWLPVFNVFKLASECLFCMKTNPQIGLIKPQIYICISYRGHI